MMMALRVVARADCTSRYPRQAVGACFVQARDQVLVAVDRDLDRRGPVHSMIRRMPPLDD
jgi:hypothetical protein